MSFIQVSDSPSAALDLGTAVRTYSKSFIVYRYILVDIISVVLGAARGRGMIQSKGIKIEGDVMSDSVSVCTHVCSYT